MNVYIDNSALRTIHYNLSHPAICTLAKAVNDKSITVLTNSILEREFLKHCETILNKEKEEIKKINCLSHSLSSKINELATEAAKIKAEDVLKMYLGQLNCQSIDKEVDWKIVFSKYFSGIPPFSNKKKDEFPDAFVIEMLEPFFEKDLVVVSGDNDFYEWAKQKKDVSVFRSVKDYVDHYIRLQNDALTKVFSSKQKEIEENVKEHFTTYFSDNHYYDITSYHSEIEWANVKKIEDINVKILSTDLDAGELEVEYTARGSVDLDINAAVVVYDSIDKEDIHLGSNSRSAEIEAEFKCKATISVDTKTDVVEVLELYDEEVYADDFEVPHEWESFLDE